MLVPEAIIEKDGYLVVAATGEKVIFYECDPAKNTSCSKTCCSHNGGSEESDMMGFCSKTTGKQYAKEGGKKWYAVKKHDPNGGADYWGREYING